MTDHVAGVEPTPMTLRTPITLTLGLVLLIVAGGGLAYVSQYEPLLQGGLSGTDGVKVRFGAQFGTSPEPTLLEYRDGRTFSVYFQIFNEGPVPVTITGAELFPPDEESLVFPTEGLGLRLADSEDEADPRRTAPFHPFRLARGSNAPLLVFRVRFDDCEHHNDESGSGGFSTDTVDVEYRVLGIPRRQEVQLASQYVIETPMKDCPTA